MKKTMSLVVVLLFCWLGTANAAPFTWTDYIDFAPDVYLTGGDQYSYTHDLTDDGFDTIFGGDLIVDYTLTLELYDDDRRLRDGLEFAWVDQPGFFGDGLYNFFGTSDTFGASIAGLISVNVLGTLDVTITALDTNFGAGDFYIASSTFEGTGYSHEPVPEPGTMLLMGLGLAGIVGARRRRKK